MTARTSGPSLLRGVHVRIELRLGYGRFLELTPRLPQVRTATEGQGFQGAIQQVAVESMAVGVGINTYDYVQNWLKP